MRVWILRLHRWSTFVLGAVFLLTCVTGSVLVFGDELDHLWSPRYFDATPGDVGPDSALASVRSAVPGRPVSWLWFPRSERPVYIGQFAAGASREYVHVDPGTGRVLGMRGEPMINVIRQLHVNFWSGVPGARVVGMVGIAFLIMIASGVYLWWPGIRKMALGFRLRRRGGAVLVNYDLHNLMGIFTTPLLVLITLTGVAIIFVASTRVVLHALWLTSPTPISRIERATIAPPDSGSRMLPLTDLVARAMDTIPGHDLMAVVFPARENAGLQVRMSYPNVRFRDGLSRVVLDPYTGEVVGTLDLRTMPPPDRFRRRWLISLHAGEYGGVPMRVIYLLVGLVPVALAGTGVAVWWLRREGRLALAEKRAAARAA